MKINKTLTILLIGIALVAGWFFLNQPEPSGAPPTGLTYQATLIPLSDSQYDLGTTTQAWRDAYVDRLCLTADTCHTSISGGGDPFAWTPTDYGVSTSTTLGFTQGFLSTASSTFTGDTHFPSGIWESNGNVGIGTTSPTSKFSLGSAGSAFRINSSGTVEEGVWNGTAIDFSDYTNATDGDGITFSDDEITADLGTSIDSTEIEDGAIVNADINESAAIAYSKLNLTDSILEADLNLNAPTDDFLLVASSSATGGFEWVATSTDRLGLSGGGGASFGSANEIPYTNSSGDDFDYGQLEFDTDTAATNALIVTGQAFEPASIEVDRIGGTSPVRYVLRTTDTEQWSIGMEGSETGLVFIDEVNSNKLLELDQGANGDINITPDGTGKVGIGTTSPSALLTVGSTTPDTATGYRDAFFAGAIEVDGVINADGGFTCTNCIDFSDETNATGGRSITLNGDAIDADAELYEASFSANLHATSSNQIATSTNVWLSKRFHRAFTITRIDCIAYDAGTSTIQADIAGSNILYETGLNCGADISTASTTLQNTAITAGQRVKIDVPDAEPTGSRPRLVEFTISGSWND